MPVVRKDLNNCIGCKNCSIVCPVDVFRFDSAAMKSVIAWPDNCQTCGQCYVNCLGDSLAMEGYVHAYSIVGTK